MSSYDRYLKTNARIDDLIDSEPIHEQGITAIRTRAVERFEWMRGFVSYLGSPQESAPVIHVTGTSGKGSTASAIASILHETGLKVLLHTSPYLQVSTEKIQIAGRLISADDLSGITDDVIVAANKYDPGRITYGEAWMAMVFLAMARFRPDVAIVEVGAGGRYDLSNVVTPQVAVITTVGIDHTESLGDTISEITWHKAGIIKPASHVVHSVSQPEAVALIKSESRDVAAASLRHVAAPLAGATESSWIDPDTGQELRSGIPGHVQKINGAVAAATARAFMPEISIETISSGLAAARIPARFERMPGNANVFLDGAHNEQKMEALIADLAALPNPRIGVIGFLASRRFEVMVQLLAPHLDGFVVSAPDIIGKAAINPDQLAAIVSRLTGTLVQVAVTTEDAIDRAKILAGETGTVLVTGSLYLCGQAREQWYPARDIVEQQTQWPG